MRTRHRVAAFVLGLASTGCGEASPLPTVSPPMRSFPSLVEQLDSALGSDARCQPTTGVDFAYRSYASPLSVEAAEVILVCTTRFEFGGMPPKRQAHAFNVVFEQADAVQRFQSIAAKAGPAGRLYAVAALQLLATSDADSLAAELARDTRPVLVQESDVFLGPRPASAMVDLVRSKRIGDDFRRAREAITAYYHKAG